MASWTSQSTSSLLPGEPWTSAKALAAFENPAALAEGASGAPRVLGEAAATNDEVAVLTVSASDAVDILENFNLTPGTLTTNSSTYVDARYMVIKSITGTARFKISHRTSNASYSSDLRLIKNGSVVSSWSTNSTSSVERTVDLSVAPGDAVYWQHKALFSISISIVSSPSETASDGYIKRSLLIASSNA